MAGHAQIKRRLYCRRPSRRPCEAMLPERAPSAWHEAAELVEADALTGMPDVMEIDDIIDIEDVGGGPEQASPAICGASTGDGRYFYRKR
jgi:hypothetical protein